MTDVIVPQDWVTSSADVHPPPLVLFDHVLWNYNVFICKENKVRGTSLKNLDSVGNTDLHTCYHPSAILIYSNPCCLALEDVIPTKRENEQEGNKVGLLVFISPTENVETIALLVHLTTLHHAVYTTLLLLSR